MYSKEIVANISTSSLMYANRVYHNRRISIFKDIPFYDHLMDVEVRHSTSIVEKEEV